MRVKQERVLVFDTRDAAAKPLELACPGYRDDLAFSPDGTRFAAGGGDAVHVWDVAASPPKELARLVRPKENVRAIAFSPDGRSIYATYHDRDGWVWDLTAAPPSAVRKLAAPLAQADALALSPDGKRVYAGVGVAVRGFDITADGWGERPPLAGHTLYTADDDVLRVWGLEGGAFAERRAVAGFASGFLVSPDERTLIASRFSFSLWDAAGLKKRTRNLDPHSHGPVRQSLSADGRWLARASWNPALSVYDLAGPEPREHAVLKELTGSRSVHSVAVSPDGAFVAAAIDQHNEGEPVLLWRVTEKGLRPVAFPYLTGDHVGFSPDGKTLAVAGGGAVTLIDLTTPAPAERLRIATDVRGSDLKVFFSPDAARVVTVGGGDVRVWDATDGRPAARWSLPHAASVALAPDGRHVAVGNTNGTVWVLRLP